MYQGLYSLQALLFKWLEISNVAKNSSKWQFVENNKKKHRKQVIDLTAEEAEIIPGTCREEWWICTF